MTDESGTHDAGERPLRKGWTTGACAAAAAKSAYWALTTGQFLDPVEIALPGGQRPSFQLAEQELSDAFARAGIVKDAGDDPDVTHGALIRAELRPANAGTGIIFKAGAGVGTVTRAGLPLAAGEPAINPAPRRMIADNLGAAADLEITISVENGLALARSTWNPRLGIEGGLSILGTTGVVIPYSCSAWIASIHQAVDVARAAGWDHIAACTGSTSEAGIAGMHGMAPERIVDMGNFIGGLLKYLRTHPVPRLSIAGGFAKLSKLAAGHMDLHSKRSQVDPAFLAGLAAEAGADKDVVARMVGASTAAEILGMAKEENIALGDAVARVARQVSLEATRGGPDMEVVIFDRAGTLAGQAPFGS
ncbi:MAG: cobalt-precorrin-5B (C(1))-methyltransferase [Rhodospirillales bacterium]|nr:cobalt-precorrin-5B (C(1))-methyltransferase [Rhodospirillales bacterium]